MKQKWLVRGGGHRLAAGCANLICMGVIRNIWGGKKEQVSGLKKLYGCEENFCHLMNIL